jgi:hypothetical protein
MINIFERIFLFLFYNIKEIAKAVYNKQQTIHLSLQMHKIQFDLGKPK